MSDATNISRTPQSLQAELLLQLAGRESMPAGTPAKAQVRFSFLKPEVLRVTITYKDASPNEISEEFSDQGEHYYGIWEHPFGGSLDNRGADRDFLGIGNERYVHHDSARAPFYMTSNHYGIYVESLAQGHYAVAQAGRTTFSFKSPLLTYDIIYGPTYADVLNRYNAMAGPAFMPPTWAFGSIWWRDDQHEDLRGAANAQEKTILDADRLRALHLPAGTIWLDRPYGSGELGWGAMDFDSSFPDPAKMIHDLNDRGMNLLLWTANRCSGDLFKEGSAKGYLFPLKWPAADIRRPEVYDWFKQKLNAYVRMGVKGYKIDRGEENEMPDSAQNELAVLFAKLSAEGLSAAYGNDYFDFVRNANDTTRRYAVLWNGDSWSTFGGLQGTVKDGLRSGVMNFPMWGSDTGGYFAPPSADNELLARWLEFSAFSPMMEVILGPKIPRGDIVKLNNNWDANWSPKLRLQFFPSDKHKSQFNYYTGSGVQTITAAPENGGLRIEFGDLGAPGTVEVYCQKVKGVTRNGTKLREGADYRFDEQTNKLTVSFQGASKIVVDGAASLF